MVRLIADGIAGVRFVVGPGTPPNATHPDVVNAERRTHPG
jgi:hypothetical protein